MKKFFFFDYDGTLTDKKTGLVPENTKKTLKNLKRNGHFVALATGRLQIDAYNCAKELDINDLVSDGGSSLTINGEIQYMHPLNMKESKILIKNVNKRNIPWGVSKENSLNIYTNKNYNSKFESPSNFTVIVNKNLDIDNIEKIYKIFFIMTKKEINETNFMSLKHVGYTNNITLVEPMEKKLGIERLQKFYNISDNDIVVFGDGINDLSLFDEKWTSIAMGNAQKSLKEKADFVTKNSWDDGITYACKRFGWL